MVEKELFLGQIFEMKILIEGLVLRSPESEDHTFGSWSVCVINFTQKQIMATTLIWYFTFL